RRIFDVAEERLKISVYSGEQLFGDVRRRSQNQVFSTYRFVLARSSHMQFECSTASFALRCYCLCLRLQLERCSKLRRQRANQGFISFAKTQQGWTLLGPLTCLHLLHHSANDAARRFFRFMQLRKRTAQTEPLWIARINSRHERAN